MAKVKSKYVCQSCGYETAGYLGKCPECGELLVKKVTKNGNFEVCSSRTCSFKHPLEDVKESEKPE